MNGRWFSTGLALACLAGAVVLVVIAKQYPAALNTAFVLLCGAVVTAAVRFLVESRRRDLHVQTAVAYWRSILREQALRAERDFLAVARRGRALMEVDFGDPELPGPVTSLAPSWAAVDAGCLSVVGVAGSGKSVAASRLVLQVLEQVGADEPLLIRIPATAQGPRDNLVSWVATAISAQRRVPKRIVEQLLETHQIVPVIDGLDELLSPTTATRAEELGRLIADALQDRGLRTVIVTTRPEAEQVLQMAIRGRSAGRVVVQPLSAVTVAQYLESEQLGSHWYAFIDSATSPGGRLDALLGSPLRVMSALERCTSAVDVEQLLALQTTDEIDRFLLPGLLSFALPPTMSARHREKALRRLRRIARYLERNRSSEQIVGDRVLSGTDITPHLLWPIGGVRPVLVVDGLLAVVMSLPGLLLIGAVCATWFGVFVGVAAALLLIVGYSYFLARRVRIPWTEPAGVDLRSALQPAGLVRLSFALVAAIAVGSFTAVFTNVLTASALGAALLVSLVLSIGPTQGAVRHRRTAESDPWRALIGDRDVSLLAGTAGTFGVTAIIPILTGDTTWVLGGIVYGALVGCTVASAVWRRYVALKLVMAWRLPWRLRRFLERLRRQYVLRVSVDSYQFTHIELQEVLAGSNAEGASGAHSSNTREADPLDP